MKSKPFIGTRSEITYREIYSRVKEKDKMVYHCILHCSTGSRDVFKVFVSTINSSYNVFPLEYYTVVQGSNCCFLLRELSPPLCPVVKTTLAFTNSRAKDMFSLFAAHLNYRREAGMP